MNWMSEKDWEDIDNEFPRVMARIREKQNMNELAYYEFCEQKGYTFNAYETQRLEELRTLVIRY